MKKKFTEKDISGIAETILKTAAKNRNTKHATIVALEGDLGAGKTTLVQAIARKLGIKENVISPTYVIIKTYKLKTKNYKLFVHIDAYRLDKESDLEKIGWHELANNRDNLICIEWPEKVPKLIPPNAIRILLSHKNVIERNIKINQNKKSYNSVLF